MALTLAVVSAGAMGSAVAARLVRAGCTVLTNLDGRSPATHDRAREAGMQDVPLPELARRASIVLSILPPRDARAFAELYSEAFRSGRDGKDGSRSGNEGEKVIFADCNAISPATVKSIASTFATSDLPIAFVDAGIIGGPPSDGYDPTFYASAEKEDGAGLDAFVALTEHGLKVSPLRGEGSGVGDASALKMSYAGISKGFTGLVTTMILSAYRSSPPTATALMHELAFSQPMVLQRATRGIPGMLPKAYRWVAEMEEISAFVGNSLGGGGEEAGESAIHHGMASIYARIEQSLAHNEEGGDVDVLKKWVDEAKSVLEAKGK